MPNKRRPKFQMFGFVSRKKYEAAVGQVECLKEGFSAIRRENKALHSKLRYWQAHGQLRDPATGRLVPKAQTAAMLEKLGGEI
ncbi:hypothetical protein GCM10007897_43640 [Sphingobium jiangsuense]|nr:hypothetical protein GCM10007897_43640 [Sphingobium jiangsuense]